MYSPQRPQGGRSPLSLEKRGGSLSLSKAGVSQYKNTNISTTLFYSHYLTLTDNYFWFSVLGEKYPFSGKLI
jgi:hypothetical protein